MIDISIIIVSWNVRELLKKCLESIERTRGGLNVEVMVIDNASTDGTQKMLSELLVTRYSLRVTLNNTNRGFAAANNQGIARATGEYVLLFNPDTELLEGSLQTMLAFMQSHPRCGVLGPKLLNVDRTHQPNIRRFPDAWSSTLMSLGLPAHRYLAHDMDYSRAQIVDQVMGACLLTRRSVIHQIGALDERFFIWFEEVDLCKRARDTGWEVWYTPDAEVIHHGGQSFAQTFTLKKQWWYSRSLLKYFWKHHQWSAFIINLLFVPLRIITGTIVSLLNIKH